MAENNAPEQIIINGQEYSTEDLGKLVDLGTKYQTLEKDLNTSLDKVVPEYTKATQRLSTIETELEEAKAQLTEKQTKVETPEDIQKARQALREIGGVDNDYLKEQGYMTKAEVEEFLSQRQTQQVLADKILKDCETYEKQIDGSDGRVPFDTESVLAFASVKGISEVMDAYNQMNKKGNARWQEAQLEKEKKAGLTTLTGGGKKEPAPIKVTNDNLKDMLSEAIYGEE